MIIQDYSDLSGIKLISFNIFHDDRGMFCETYKKSEFKKHGINLTVVQENQSVSKANVIRGLHAQKSPHEQGKLVRCLQGAILDVFVDLRKESKTFGRWACIYLTGGKASDCIWIPKGFLHGFRTVENDTIVSYKTNHEYNKESEIGVVYNDPTLNINWGWGYSSTKFIVSEKDLALPTFNEMKDLI